MKTLFSPGCAHFIAVENAARFLLPSMCGLAQLVLGCFFRGEATKKTILNLYIIGRKRQRRFQPQLFTL
ncbi:MAG: hypothetical protein IJQ53_05815, partial [Clostridia bacterium]|nr:hypothetical protein [Clostridia bacterium]